VEEGWACKVSARGPDGGVDVIAERGDERVAVQTKMYRASGRRVKTSDVRDLHGAAKLAGCARAMLVTDSTVPPGVGEACRILEIELREIPSDNMEDPPDDPPEHWRVWVEQVMPLEGTTIERRGGEQSQITLVDAYGLERITRGSGSKRPVPFHAFQWVIERVGQHGSVTQSEFRVSEARGRYGGFLFDLIAGLDEFEEDPSAPTRAVRRSDI
jgi:restriction system protein